MGLTTTTNEAMQGYPGIGVQSQLYFPQERKEGEQKGETITQIWNGKESKARTSL